MEQRHMCTRQMHDLNIEQFRTHHFLHESELGVFDSRNGGGQSVLPSAGPVTGLDVFSFPDNHEGSMVYGNRRNMFQPPSAIHLGSGGSAASNSYNPYLFSPSTSNGCHFPANHGSSEHLSSSSHHHRLFGITLDEVGNDSQFMDNGRSGKRKNAEGVPGGMYRCIGPSAGSSSSSSSMSGPQTTFCGPVNAVLRPWNKPFGHGNSLVEAAASFNIPHYMAGSNMPASEDASSRSVRSRSNAMNLQVGLGLSHHHGQIFQGNYMDRSVQPPNNNAWPEHFVNNTTDSGNTSWNDATHAPFMPGRNVNGNLVDIPGMNSQGYPDTTAYINPGLINPPSMPYPIHYSSPIHSVRGRANSLGYPSLVVPPAQRISVANSFYGSLNPSHGALESVPRYPRSVVFGGDRSLRSNRRVSQASQGNINDRWSHFPFEDVAFLDSSSYYEVEGSVDQHRDMRMDIDDMTYEELLALEERIGDVSTGLSEEVIATYLKTRSLTLSDSTFPSREGMKGVDHTCTICQVEFAVDDAIGTLDCGHEYHAECVRQWLLLKNVCPVCKTAALTLSNKG